MPKARHPHRGSMQFWPRKRSKRVLARVRSWADEKTAKPLGFIAYKAGMTHVLASDNRPKSLTKGERITLPVTIIECPPNVVVGVSFYKKSPSGLRKSGSVFAESLPKSLQSSVPKNSKKLDSYSESDDIRLIVASIPVTGKKPRITEIALGGSTEEKLAYAKEHLGKEIAVGDIFEVGASVDIHGITKGKGYQGTVKRYGVPIRQKKSEKTKRGIGNLGAWTPKRVDFRVPQPGKMGYHIRTEYNKQILTMGDDGQDVTPAGGITKYGVVKEKYLLLKGSVAGPRKREVVLTQSIRPNAKHTKDAFDVGTIIK